MVGEARMMASNAALMDWLSLMLTAECKLGIPKYNKKSVMLRCKVCMCYNRLPEKVKKLQLLSHLLSYYNLFSLMT